ncbi:glycerate kinase [Enterococcus alishanensis]
MKILVAMDSFKGSATSKEINQAVADGMKKINPQAEISTYSVADGGEGTIAAFYENDLGQLMEVTTLDLFNQPISAIYVLFDEKTVVLEVAETAGIHFLSEEKENKYASSFGVGDMLRRINEKHPEIEKFIIGLGGSGINDAGIGMMQALGISFKKNNGEEIVYGTTEIEEIMEIDISKFNQALATKEFILLSDVKNPLTGPSGATYIFGKQKGVIDLEKVDQALQHYAKVLTAKFEIDYSKMESTGAAGGIGISFLYFLNSHFVSGAEYITEMLALKEKMATVDLVITGEGKMDRQSAYGKLPTIIAQLAKSQQKKVIAVVGDASEVTTENYQAGIDLILSLPRGPMTLRDSIEQTKKLASQTGEDIMRIMKKL